MLEQLKIVNKNMPNNVEILQCKVINEEPLTIQEVNNPKRRIPQDLISLARNVTDFKTNISIDSIDKEITIKNKLKINDIILVVVVDDFQKFIVIDRLV